MFANERKTVNQKEMNQRTVQVWMILLLLIKM